VYKGKEHYHERTSSLLKDNRQVSNFSLGCVNVAQLVSPRSIGREREERREKREGERERRETRDERERERDERRETREIRER